MDEGAMAWQNRVRSKVLARPLCKRSGRQESKPHDVVSIARLITILCRKLAGRGGTSSKSGGRARQAGKAGGASPRRGRQAGQAGQRAARH